MQLPISLFIRYLFLLLLTSFGWTACRHTPKPITAEEVRQFSRELESSVEKRDPAFFNEAIDRDEMARRAGVGDSKKAKDFTRGMRNAANMGTKIIQSISKNATYELVKQYEKDGTHHIIFRLYDDGSINYHDLELIRKKDQLKIADIFVYTTGEPMSATLKNLFDQMEGVADAPGSDQWIRSMPRIREKINDQDYEGAYELFMKTPEQVRHSKAFRIVLIEICSGLDDEKHQQAIEDLLAAYPNEPNMQLILFDAYFLRKEYPKVLSAIDAVDKMINKDPFLDYYRYLCYTVMGEDAVAKEHLLRVARQYPRFPDAQIELAATYILEEKMDSARLIVRNYKQRKSFPQEKLDDLLAAYPAFTPE